MGVNTCEVGVVTEPECLGPCEPGTSVNLEGIVWHETEEGKYNLFLFISPCPLPHDVFMSPVRGICFMVGIWRGKKSDFYALWIFVEIRTMFVFLFMAAFTFRMNQVSLKVAPHFKC